MWFTQKHAVFDQQMYEDYRGGNGRIVPDARRPWPCSCYQLFTYGGKLVLRGSIAWGLRWKYNLPSLSTAASTCTRLVLVSTWLMLFYSVSWVNSLELPFHESQLLSNYLFELRIWSSLKSWSNTGVQTSKVSDCLDWIASLFYFLEISSKVRYPRHSWWN